MYNHQKMENIKDGAFLDYFKFFSINAAETIRKLQITIQQQLSDDIFFDANNMFKRIKTLLSSYQLLVLQINDSCEFVEIPQFGVCILKIFFQLMSIIRFMAKSIIVRSVGQKSVEKQKRIDQRHTMLSAPISSLDKKNSNGCNPGSIERQNFRIKEMASHIFKDLNKEVVVLQREQRMMIQENDDTFQKISRGRQRLQEIQISQNQALLSEAVSMLYKKGEYINSFLNQIQSSINLQAKENINAENYSKIKELYEEDTASRLQVAKDRLNQLFRQYVQAAELRKKQAMVSEQCQVFIQEECNEQKNKSHSQGKKFMNEQIKKLKNENKTIEEENITLKVMISEKTESFDLLMAKVHSQKQQLSRKNTFDRQNTTKKIKRNQIENGEGHSNKFAESKDNDECEDELLHKIQKGNNVVKSNKSKIKLHENEKGLWVCDRVIHFIANYPSCYVFNRDVFQSQTVVYEIQRSKQPQNINPFNEQSNQQLECNDQFRIVQQKAKFLKKRYKPRMSCGLIGWQGRSQENVTDFCDSPLLRIKTGNVSPKKIQTTFIEEKQNHTTQQIFQLKKQPTTTVQLKSSKPQPNHKISIRSKAQYSTTHNASPSSGFKIQKKQTIPVQVQSHVASSIGLPIEKPMNAPINLPVYTDLKLSGKGINFQKQDLINLFLSQDNARNYELLNLSLGLKSNNYLTTLGSKNVVMKQVKQTSSQRASRMNSIKNGIAVGKQSEAQNINRCNTIINLIYKGLKILSQIKKQPEFTKYHCIKNFIRFPHSSVYRRNENSWKQHEKENNNLEYVQLKRYITRIMKFHCYCYVQQGNKYGNLNSENFAHNFICEHWRTFLRRLGANVSNQY